MDRAKFGEALAKTMDRLEKLAERGDLDGYELDEVLVVAAFLKPYEEDVEISPDALETMVFVDGSTQVPYTQLGILRLAFDTVTEPE